MSAFIPKRYPHGIIKCAVFGTLMFGYTFCFSQPSTFFKMYNNGNIGYAVREVNGNSYTVAGGTDFYYNFHWQIMSSFASTNIHLFKTDDRGNLLWEKIYGNNTSRTIATWMEHTADGGYIIAGSDNKDLAWPPDSNDVVLIKTNGNGVIAWSKKYDTGKDELGFCVRQTFDGGFIVSGFHDAMPVSLFGPVYALLIKTDINGNVTWVKKYELAVRDLNTHEPFSYVVRQTSDGGFVIVGSTLGSHPADAYVIRADVNGNLLWAKSYEHDASNFRVSLGLDITESASGDFIIAGSMDKDQPLMQFNYPYILKISNTGAIIDAKFFDSNPVQMFQSGFSSVQQTADGGFFFTGMGGYSGFGTQAQLLKTDVNFNMQWSRVYTWDGIATMGSRSGRETSDGYYVFTGKRQMDGTVLMKTDNQGLIPCKNPGVLLPLIPSIIVQNRTPAVLTGINVNPFLINTQVSLIDTSTVCTLITLPVELTYFSGIVLLPDKHVQLDWITASEIDNDYFVVEKSADGKNFEETGRISGAGNSTGLINYSFVDKHPFDARISYYRLKQVDYNGASVFSRVIPVSFSNDDFELINAFPDYDNRSIKIYLHTNAMENITSSLMDMPGKIIFHDSQTSVPEKSGGISVITIDASNISQGIYYFTVSNGRTMLARKIFY